MICYLWLEDMMFIFSDGVSYFKYGTWVAFYSRIRGCLYFNLTLNIIKAKPNIDTL